MVDDIRSARPDVVVVVVDDGSTDETGAEAARAGARVVPLPFNMGIGAAVQTGFRLAYDEGFDIAVQVDGDGQHPASHLNDVLSPILKGEASYVIGSRFVEETGYVAPKSRRSGMVILSWLVSRIVGKQVTDTTSGFRAADRKAIALFASHYPHDYPEVEALVMAAREGLDIIEVPVVMRQRASGASSITPIRSVYYMVKVILAVLVQSLGRRPRPGETT